MSTLGDEAAGAVPVPAPVHQPWGVRLLPVVLGGMLGLAGAGNSAAAVVLPALAHDIQVDSATSVWVISLFALCLAVATPVYGRVADTVGIRTPLFIGVSLMVLGSALSAIAMNLPLLLVARAVQGTGAAAVPVLAVAAVRATARHPGALARQGAVGVGVGTLGPLLGGTLHAVSGWRAAMAIPVLGVLALPLIWRVVPRGGTGSRIDLGGALLVAVAVTGLVLTVQSPSAGLSAAVIGSSLLVVGVLATIVWARDRADGFLPHEVMTNRPVLRSLLPGGAVPAAWFGLMLGVPQVLSRHGWKPLDIGLLLIPASALGLIVPLIIMRRILRRTTLAALRLSCSLTVVALLITALGAVRPTPVLICLGMVCMSVGFAIGQPAFMDTVARAVDDDVRGVALGIASLAFLTGCGFGSAWVGGVGHALDVSSSLALLACAPLIGIVMARQAPKTTSPNVREVGRTP